MFGFTSLCELLQVTSGSKSRKALVRTAWVFAVWLGCITAAAAQLPPEILADQYLLQAEQQIAKKDHQAALESLQKILALQKEHGLTLPEAFHLKHAQVAFAAGSFSVALDSVNQYLVTVGREGEFYRQALELLNRIEQIQKLDRCTKDSWSESCWQELEAPPPNCVVWVEYYLPARSVTWSGSCAYGKADGEGTLKWTQEGKELFSSVGQLEDGKQQGTWYERWSDGDTQTGPYVDGIRHGQWTLTTADGSQNDGRVQRGRYVRGEKDGTWEISWPSGQTLQLTYADGILSGPTVRRLSSGSKTEGKYVDGLKEGTWTEYDAHNDLTTTETYSKGKLNGPWREDGKHCDSWGNYEEGRKEGHWKECNWSGGDYNEETGPYVEGKRHGTWEHRHYISETRFFADDPFRSFLEGTSAGEFKNGKRDGFWIYKQAKTSPYADWHDCYTSNKYFYVDGKQQGNGWQLNSDCKCFEVVMDGNETISRKKVRRKHCRREIYRK